MKRVIAYLLMVLMICSMAATVFAGEDPVEQPGKVWQPAFSKSVQKAPVKEEQLPDGSLKQIFEGISTAEFEAFCTDAKEVGCEIKGEMSDADASALLLEKGGKIFTVVYDAAEMTAEVVYAAGSAPEKYMIGDVVILGSYEQDNDLSNGSEPIEWLVLAMEGDRALLISKYALDCKKYNDVSGNITWGNSSLRTWLNSVFYQAAFTTEEQSKILEAEIQADKNPIYSTSAGKNTKDAVFLLSIPEAEEYFSDENERRCAPTAYAVAQGAYVNKDYKTADNLPACWWWLRSPGYYQNFAAYVNYDGSVTYRGSGVIFASDCVRPALWINLES